MSEVTRRTVAPPPTPANWFSVKVNSLTVYRTAQDDSYTETQQVPLEDANGDYAYTADGLNHEYYPEGTQPEGYTLVTNPSQVLIPRAKRGDIVEVQIVEEDAAGAAIPPEAEGYPGFKPFDTDTLRARAAAKPATIGLKFHKAVVALQELADALYEDAKEGSAPQ